MAKHAKKNSKLYLVDYLDELLKFVLFPIFVSSIIYLVFNGNPEVENTKFLKVLLSYFEFFARLLLDSHELFGKFCLIIVVSPFALELIDKTPVPNSCVVTIFRNMIKLLNVLSFIIIIFYVLILYLVSIEDSVISEETITIIPLYYALLLCIYDVLKKLIKGIWNT